MDFIVIFVMILLVKKPCFCNNESVFYNFQVEVQTSSSTFLLVDVICFQNSSSALSSLMTISTVSKFTMWFKLKLKVFFFKSMLLVFNAC
jgi:hypothetical protein